MVIGLTVSLIPMIISFIIGKAGAFVVAAALAVASAIMIVSLFKSGVRRFNEI